MKAKELFDINREPPTAEEVDAAIRGLKRKAQRYYCLWALCFVGLCGLIFTPKHYWFFIYLIAFAGGAAASLLVRGVRSELSELMELDDADLHPLTELVGPGRLTDTEKIYIQRVLRQGRRFRRFELKTLKKTMALRRSGQVRASLEAVMQAQSGDVSIKKRGGK